MKCWLDFIHSFCTENPIVLFANLSINPYPQIKTSAQGISLNCFHVAHLPCYFRHFHQPSFYRMTKHSIRDVKWLIVSSPMSVVSLYSKGSGLWMSSQVEVFSDRATGYRDAVTWFAATGTKSIGSSCSTCIRDADFCASECLCSTGYSFLLACLRKVLNSPETENISVFNGQCHNELIFPAHKACTSPQ